MRGRASMFAGGAELRGVLPVRLVGWVAAAALLLMVLVLMAVWRWILTTIDCFFSRYPQAVPLPVLRHCQSSLHLISFSIMNVLSIPLARACVIYIVGTVRC